MERSAIYGPTLGLLIFALWAGSALAQDSFTEHFNTDIYHDDGLPNHADWNTEEGVLKFWPFEPNITATEDTPGNAARKVALHGYHAFVADGYFGVQVMDISDPDDPSLVGNYNSPGYVYQIHVHGDHAYVADHSGGMRVLDISVPHQPVEIASVNTPQVALGIWVDGDYAYLGCGDGGVVIVDITTPWAPTTVANISTPGAGANRLQVYGDWAYVCDGNGGMAILNVIDPTSPSLAATMPLAGYARDLVVQGGFAYVTSHGSGLAIVDVGDPANPNLTSTFAVSGELRGMDMQGSRAFLCNVYAGIQVIDTSDKTAPVLERTIDTDGACYDAAVRGEYAFVPVFSAGMQSIKISQRIDPVRVSRVDAGGYYTIAPLVDGHLAFWPDTQELQVWDCSDPAAPEQLDALHTGHIIGGMARSGNFILTAGNGTFSIIDVSDPSNINLRGSVSINNYLYPGMAVSGDYAFLACNNELVVVEFSNPDDPSVAFADAIPNLGNRVLTQGNLAIVTGTDTARLFDISNPTSPVLTSNFHISSSIVNEALVGDLLYLASFLSGLHIVDVSDIYAPYLAGTYYSNSRFIEVQVMGNTAILAENDEIMVVDITDPRSPAWYWSMGLEESYSHLIPMGEFMICRESGQQEMDILQAFQHEVDYTRRQAASEFIPTGQDSIYKVRYRTDMTGLASWELAVNYEELNEYPPLENTWYQPLSPGPGLNWWATLQYVPGAMTEVNAVTFDWLYHHPFIASVNDVPGDQGGQVRVDWARSGHDFVGDPQQVVEYAIYRQIEETAPAKAQSGWEIPGASAALQTNAELMLNAGWDFVATVPVLVQDRYAMVVPTLADSTAFEGDHDSTFKVVGLTSTPGVFFTSPGMSGSSVDNLAPSVPSGVLAGSGPQGVILTWEEAEDEDFRFFRVYQGSEPNFIPGPDYLVHETVEPQWIESAPGKSGNQNRSGHYFAITSVDFGGNESEPARVQFASDTPQAGPGFVFHGAAPNPFNPSTRLAFSLPEENRVSLTIYDLAGRQVKVLADEVMTAGDHQRHWDGRDRTGRAVASGAYFAVLRSGHLVRQQRLMLMK